MRPKFIIGYTDTETVKLDLDNTAFQKAKYWASITLKKFDLGGFLILKSSKNCYHVIFDRTVSWPENMSIVAWVSLLSHNEKLRNWLIMQCIKKESTLRISPKKNKPSPKVVYSYGDQDTEIENFQIYQKMVRRMINRLAMVHVSSTISEQPF